MKASSLIPHCAALTGYATAAHAASGAESDGTSLVMIVFFSCIGVIVVWQLFPGAMLFLSMIKGLFSASKRSATTAGKADGASDA